MDANTIEMISDANVIAQDAQMNFFELASTGNFDKLYDMALQWTVTSGPRLLLIAGLAYAGIKISKTLICRAMTKKNDTPEHIKRTCTLTAVLTSVVTVTILLAAIGMALGEFGVKLGPLLAAAGVVGIAIGFGGQYLVKDLISGFFLLLDDQIRVGDVVDIAGKAGLVERVNLRMTVLRDFAGSVHFVPNGEIKVVTNMTKEWSRYVFDIGVAYRENVDEVIEVIKMVGEELRNDPKFKELILEPIEVLGLDRFADSALIIKARIKTLPIQQWNVGREFNARLKKAFDARGIEIPFPHMTLYMGQNKDGSAPAMNVKKLEQPN